MVSQRFLRLSPCFSAKSTLKPGSLQYAQESLRVPTLHVPSKDPHNLPGHASLPRPGLYHLLPPLLYILPSTWLTRHSSPRSGVHRNSLAWHRSFFALRTVRRSSLRARPRRRQLARTARLDLVGTGQRGGKEQVGTGPVGERLPVEALELQGAWFRWFRGESGKSERGEWGANLLRQRGWKGGSWSWLDSKS